MPKLRRKTEVGRHPSVRGIKKAVCPVCGRAGRCGIENDLIACCICTQGLCLGALKRGDAGFIEADNWDAPPELRASAPIPERASMAQVARDILREIRNERLD